MDSPDAIYDKTRLLDEYRGEPDLLSRVIDAFEREYVDRMARLRDGIEAQDKWTINREGHAFKGSVATFFARSAANTAGELENARDFPTASRLANVFEQDVAHLMRELKQVIARDELAESGSKSSSLLNVPKPSPEGVGKTTETPVNPPHPSPTPGEQTETLVLENLHPAKDGSGKPTEQPDFIGRFQVLEPIGKGGFGTVFKGFDERLDREVAIKVPRLRDHNSRDDRVVEVEFLHEARRVAQLSHPNVVTVHDVGVDEGRCYIISEYLKGPDLNQWTTFNEVSWRDAARIVAEIADGLASAHAKEIVHRDVKPANIIMTQRDDRTVPVLVDFGLAANTMGGRGVHEHEGIIKGTPNYMAPEQSLGQNRRIDGRTDIYALGVVLYRLLTGQLPFRSDDVAELLQMVQQDYPVPPRQYVHHVPRDLERICLTALAKDQAGRQTSAVDFAADLRQVIREHEPPAANKLVVREDGSKIPKSGIQILIAEDDEPTRIKLASDIEAWGHEVQTACDGEEAWQMFQKGDFSIVITDWNMPRIDGIQLVEHIRARAHTDYVYIIMLTSRSAKEDIVAGLRVGADDFLTKPYHRDELDVRIRAGRRIATMTRELTDSNQRMRASFEAATRMVLSRLPDRDFSGKGFSFAWQFHPCPELGGDLVNLIRLDGKRTAFFVIDVEGHGIPAALLASSVSDQLLKAAELQEDSTTNELCSADLASPAELCRKLNRRYANDSKITQSFRLLYGVIDREKRELRCVNAGQPVPLPASGQRITELAELNGPPIGLLPEDTSYSEVVLRLRAGERLLFFTDGLIEAVDPRNVAFGVRRLTQAVLDKRGESASALLHHVANSIHEWRSVPHTDDDLAALIIEAD